MVEETVSNAEAYLHLAIPELKKMLTISTEQPLENGQPKIISSADVVNGQPDTWYRKGKFSVALGYLSMIKEAIDDPKLSNKIDAMSEYCVGEKFVSKNPTTLKEVKLMINLIKDVISHFEN